ncbi:hypothetical protein L596_028626 [Steinernema carpocapsae]|uniref:GAR domain-containing protein n=1 Tax=Steinernema carpocapsae TaxID=34508 RepID=A0A4U5LZ09_STECR|nr:hypothetical protein L596_028626 [Steinernema carpocapsae]
MNRTANSGLFFLVVVSVFVNSLPSGNETSPPLDAVEKQEPAGFRIAFSNSTESYEKRNKTVLLDDKPKSQELRKPAIAPDKIIYIAIAIPLGVIIICGAIGVVICCFCCKTKHEDVDSLSETLEDGTKGPLLESTGVSSEIMEMLRKAAPPPEERGKRMPFKMTAGMFTFKGPLQIRIFTNPPKNHLLQNIEPVHQFHGEFVFDEILNEVYEMGWDVEEIKYVYDTTKSSLLKPKRKHKSLRSPPDLKQQAPFVAPKPETRSEHKKMASISLDMTAGAPSSASTIKEASTTFAFDEPEKSRFGDRDCLSSAQEFKTMGESIFACCVLPSKKARRQAEEESARMEREEAERLQRVEETRAWNRSQREASRLMAEREHLQKAADEAEEIRAKCAALQKKLAEDSLKSVNDTRRIMELEENQRKATEEAERLKKELETLRQSASEIARQKEQQEELHKKALKEAEELRDENQMLHKKINDSQKSSSEASCPISHSSESPAERAEVKPRQSEQKSTNLRKGCRKPADGEIDAELQRRADFWRQRLRKNVRVVNNTTVCVRVGSGWESIEDYLRHHPEARMDYVTPSGTGARSAFSLSMGATPLTSRKPSTDYGTK